MKNHLCEQICRRGRHLENNYESNLEPLCSLLGEQDYRLGMTRAAYGANQWSLAPQWHPSRRTGAPVATINQMCRRAPVPAAEPKPHAPSSGQSGTQQSAATWSGWSTPSRRGHGCNEAAAQSGMQSRIRERAATWGEGRAPRRRGRVRAGSTR